MIGAAFVWEATHLSVGAGWMLGALADPLAIVIGGAIVRTCRSAAKPALPLSPASK
jgi:hypothetical protein